MNKKILMFGIPLLAIAIVSALVVLSFSVTVNTSQSVFVDGEPQAIPCLGGETCIGEPVVITNNANVNAELKLVNDADCEDVEISYVGKLDLTKKDLAWNPIGELIEITYTVVGEEFEFSEIPVGYTLIYYKDEFTELGERIANPQPAITVTSDIGNLPQVNDANIDSLANYCQEPDNYEHCKGGKLWLVPTADLTGETLNWANMANYYYETDLIYYFANAEDNIVVPAGSNLVIYPQISVATLAGNETCEFIVDIESQ